nr:transcription factor DUO1 [Tanacetum cinerariifolium]
MPLLDEVNLLLISLYCFLDCMVFKVRCLHIHVQDRLPPEGGESGGSCVWHKNDDAMMMAPEMFMDDFPMDMFDNIEPLPSPSDW